MNRASLAVLADGRSGIVVGGDLSDPGWKGAAVVATFFETVFGDNRAPSVTTGAWLAYDDRYLYIAVRCNDPDPQDPRASLSWRGTLFAVMTGV